MRKAYLKAIVAGIVFLAFWTDKVQAQEDTGMVRSLRVYGFAMVDMGYNFNQIDPRWFDALRINRLPTYKNQFAPDGTFFFGVRQTRFGVAGYTPTKIGDLKVVYEFDMFGTGADEGQTTMRLRYAYGELGRFLAGQATSPFMDDDAWPNTIEYWGPSGMVFYRNVQIRYAPIKTADKELFIALERPGSGADKGTSSIPEFSALDSVKAKLSAPDVSAHFKKRGKWGSVQLAGVRCGAPAHGDAVGARLCRPVTARQARPQQAFYFFRVALMSASMWSRYFSNARRPAALNRYSVRGVRPANVFSHST